MEAQLKCMLENYMKCPNDKLVLKLQAVEPEKSSSDSLVDNL